MRIVIIIGLLAICLGLFLYCNLKEEEKYKEIIKFSTQSGPVNANYSVLTDNDNDDIVRGNRYPLNSQHLREDKGERRRRMMRERRRNRISPELNTDGIKIRPYGFYNEVPDINEYIHSFDYNTGHRVLDGYDIHNTRAENDIDMSDLNIINVNDFYKPYDFHYKPVVNSGAYPLRDSQVELKNGMITSIYPNICARYGSSSINELDIDSYFRSTWCDIGVLTNSSGTVPYNVLNLSAQFVGNSSPSQWRYRVYNKATSSYVFLPEDTRGTGTYQCLRDGDKVMNVAGFPGTYICQIQTNPIYVYERV